MKKINYQNSLKFQKLENDNFQIKNNNKFFKQRIEKLESEVIHLLKLNNEIKQNSKKEIDQIKNEQKKNLRICMNNFKELKNYDKYLENNCLDLYELCKDLAAQLNLHCGIWS